MNPQWGTRRPIRGVLFDMDGLVLDTEKLYSRFWAEGARALGFPMTHEQALGLRSLNREACQAKLSSYFGPEIRYSEVKAKRIELMDAFVKENGVEAKPGIRELLSWLKAQGIRTAITTSSPQDRIAEYLGYVGLLDSFDCLCSGYDVPHGKPEPDIYLYGAKCIGLAPEECLALEDSPAGIESAYRAGCLPVLIPDQDVPGGEDTLKRLYAMADSLADVIDILKEK